MNKDQIKGTANEVAGKVQKNVGKATANGTQQIKGTVREVAGKVQKAVGDAKSDMQSDERRKSDREMYRDTH